MGRWICGNEKPEKTHFYWFSKEYDLNIDSSEQLKAIANVSGDTRYRLYVNGKFVCEGPCQGSQYQKYYETEDIAPYLKEGKNEIKARVLYLEEDSFISLYRRSRPAFMFECRLVSEGKDDILLETDETWKCERVDSVTFRHFPGIHVSMAPMENVHGREKLTEIPVMTLCGTTRGGYNLFGIKDKYKMESRPIPQMDLRKPEPFRIVRRGENWIELDAGEYTTAFPEISFKAGKGTDLKIIYSECYVFGEDERTSKGIRDGYSLPGARLAGPFDEIETGESEGEFTFSPFWYRAFRFVRLEYTGSEIDFTGLAFRKYFYPLDIKASFRCSDENINRMWDVSINTVLCCSHEMYVDCPFYEQQQYDMDSCLEAIFTMRLGNDYRLPLKCLTDMAHSQIEDGMLQANYPSEWVQIIPDFTLFWVLMLREFIRYAPDNAEIRSKVSGFLGTMDKALESFERFRDESGLIGKMPYWSFVDWVPGWMAGITPGGYEGEPLTVTSMMFVAALKAASEIASYCGRTARSSEYLERAYSMSEIIRSDCFDSEAGLYKNTPFRNEYSQHTTLWAVLSGIVSGSAAEKLVRTTFETDRHVSVCTFSMNYFLFRALEKSGCYEYAPRLLEGWQKMLDNHCTTWCENPDSPRSECHGWSSAPVYEISRMILGVFPSENGYRDIKINPTPIMGVTWAEGDVPTPYGILHVEWKLDKDGKTDVKAVYKE